MKRIALISLILLSLAVSVSSQTVPEMPVMEFGQTIEKELKPQERHSYKVRLKAGQFAKIEVTQKGCDVVLMVVAPENKNLVEIRNSVEGEGIEATSIAVDKTDDYELRILNFGEKAGNYSAKIAELRPAKAEEINFTAGWKLQNEAIKLASLNPTANAIEQAIGKFEQAHEKFTLAKTVREQNTALHNIGTQYSRLGKRQKAIEYFQQVLQQHRATGRKREIAIILESIGKTYSSLGKWQSALENLAEAIAAAKEADTDMPQISSLAEMGSIYEKLDDFDKSELLYRQSLEKAKTIKSAMFMAVALNGLGKVAFHRGNYPQALDYFQQASEVEKESLDHRNEVLYVDNIGQTYFAVGETQKSIEFFQRSLELSQKKGDKVKEARTLRHLGKVYLETGELSKADNLLLKSLSIYRHIEDPTQLAETLFSLAKVKQKLGKMDEAQILLEEALKLIESFRSNISSNELRDGFSSTLYDFYGLYLELLMSRHAQEPNKNYAENAWLASERGRARNLLNLLNESNADIYEEVNKDLLGKERETYNLLNARLENLTRVLSGKNTPKQVEALKQEVEEIRGQYQLIQSKIREQSPRYAALTQPQPLSIKEVQTQLLDTNTALLSYSLGAEKSFLWLITKDNWQVFELPKRAEIETRARKHYELLTARNLKIKFETPEEKRTRLAKSDAEFPQIANELSQVLLGQVKNLLGNRRLLIVSDGALQYVPFASLKLNNRYLVETNEIVNLPSASALGILRRETLGRKPAPKTVAVLADPVFEVTDERFTFAKVKLNKDAAATRSAKIDDLTRSRRDFGETEVHLARLPFTRKEAETISKLVFAGQRRVALDFAATRQLALSEEMNQYRILHFATHGFLNSKNPELSGLVFSLLDAEGNQQNGFLRTDEVFNLKLSAELVVLSACKTGLGKDVRGEGLIGMTRGFMYAGASRVMVSFWDVNDEATAELMGQFYQKLLAGKMNPSKALREVQLNFLKKHTHANPYFWAAFTLHGEV
jgi:CHAT domain-containing protein/Tfp pilus assembly protein PilF